MSTRPSPSSTHPAPFRRLLALHQEVEQAAADAGLERDVVELVKTRASQINGCAYCTDMHARDAAEAGVTSRQLAVLPVWQETQLFSPDQLSVLIWAGTVIQTFNALNVTTPKPLPEH